ncbi:MULTISPECIES: carbonic anhydrase family protein [Chryseobacterium]|uniref:carbonic anhydrase n=1 Tax=Chryseobacterium geocarposphaerae TaxID=1416776 RepID=A0ABU1LEY8_9FLAO|nr:MULTISPECIES: carbonic anhydrase family protein [Chryseobacterium]MDR6405286.1 carbonic anhydrase [Chryseobacterium geocarposphaerae]MDR6697445.1 carbonic anhydrase [Chryseobacterium ginsenosidimutans]
MRKKVNLSLALKSNARKIVVMLGLIPALLLTSCQSDNETLHELNSYPSDIISTPISTSNIPAAVAEAQTPINIEPSKAVVFHSIDPTIHYGAVTLSSVQNNAGENLRVNVSGTDSFNNYITVNGKKYNLVNFHFHYSSEHTVDGKYSTMEIHFVNVAADNSYAVLGVLVDLGSGNTLLQNLFSQSPVNNNAINSPNTTFDISGLLPTNSREYFTYNGSLTTPNFGANSSITNGGPVTWFVFKNKQQLSADQFNSYKSIYTEPNFRAIQPLNGRKVYMNPGN